MELKNGVYEGELANYKREGRGILFGDEGIMYIGFEDNYRIKMITLRPNHYIFFIFFTIKGIGKMIS